MCPSAFAWENMEARNKEMFVRQVCELHKQQQQLN